MRPLALLLALLLGSTAALAAEKFPVIAREDLVQALAAGPVTLIDANGSSSFRSGRLPGAIDYASRKAELARLLPADKGALIVAYCGSEACPSWRAAATAATALGYTNVRHFKAGLAGWRQAGGPLERD
jgi:rhodanese-related sulfurtransferase